MVAWAGWTVAVRMDDAMHFSVLLFRREFFGLFFSVGEALLAKSLDMGLLTAMRGV